MWLNAVAAAVLAACIAAGAWSGALVTGLRIATLVLAYVAGAVLGPIMAPELGARLGLRGAIATVVAGAAAFVLSYLALAIAARFVRRLGRRSNSMRSPRDRFVGATFGALRGAFLAITIVYAAMWFDALRATGTAALVPEIGDSVATRVTSGVVQTAIERSIDTTGPAGRSTVRMASDPAVYAAELQSVVDDPAVERLRGDAQFWKDVEDGKFDAAMHSPSFTLLAQDAPLRQKFAGLGLVPDDAILDPSLFRASMAQVLKEIGPRLRGLRRDPAVQELLADPAVVAMLENRDTLGLLGNPKFRELVSRAAAAPPES